MTYIVLKAPLNSNQPTLLILALYKLFVYLTSLFIIYFIILSSLLIYFLTHLFRDLSTSSGIDAFHSWLEIVGSDQTRL